MNIHPIIVHFPIALLALYAIFECFRFRKLIESQEWFYVKATFLFLGGLGALAAAMTGDFGKHLYPAAYAIIRVHENFADLTIAIFGILAVIYMAKFIDGLWGNYLRDSRCRSIWSLVMKIDEKLFTVPVLVPLAIVGFLALAITGALGGSIVYGAANDPFMQIVNQLFVG